MRQWENLPACGGCGAPVAEEGSPCQTCQGVGVRPFARVVRSGVFEDPIKHLIHRMKYHSGWQVAEMLADRAWELPEVREVILGAGVLVPVPLHPLKHISRGFNQADVLARRLSKLSGVKVAHPAARIRNTPSQTERNRAKRIANVRDVFALTKPGKIAGRHIVLIDDVMTTGATLRSLARVLAPAKPASMSAFVLAVADRGFRGFDLGLPF